MFGEMIRVKAEPNLLYFIARDVVKKYANGRIPYSDQEDVVQDIVCRMVYALSRIDPKRVGTMAAYLRTVATHHFVYVCRKHAREVRREKEYARRKGVYAEELE